MNDNEIISEWVGLEIVKAVDEGLKGLLVEDGKLFYGKGGLRYALPDGGGCRPWQPDTDITLWHGPGGLIEKIEEKGLLQRFVDKLTVVLGLMIEVEFDGSEWLAVEYLPVLIKATPAQLSAALVATIKEQHADVHPA